VSDSPVLDGASLVFFATPPEVTRSLAPTVGEMVPAVIDVGSSLAGDAPLWVPFAGTRTVEEIAQQGQIVGSPSAAAVAIATILGPLVRLGASACRATVLVSAGSAGKAGVEELSQQVIALFNSREPPRTVFPTGLAFDLLPQVGELGADGVSSVESRSWPRSRPRSGWLPSRSSSPCSAFPSSAGSGLELHVEIDPLPDLADIRAELEGVPTIELGEPIPGPKRLVGKSRLRVGDCVSTRWGTASTWSPWATTCGSAPAGMRSRLPFSSGDPASSKPRADILSPASAMRSRSHRARRRRASCSDGRR
jgi:aspartate-semialdehyde dehydrogenase